MDEKGVIIHAITLKKPAMNPLEAEASAASLALKGFRLISLKAWTFATTLKWNMKASNLT